MGASITPEQHSPSTVTSLPGAAERLDALSARLGVEFVHPALLLQALLHRSAVLEAEREGRPTAGIPSNERLEFLGDAVVNLVVARLAFDRFPEHGEGGLTEVKTGLVRRSTMAVLAESLGLGDLVYMGRAEAKGESRGRATVLAEAMEAVVGAIFLDQGFDRAEQVLLAELSPRLEALLERSIGLNAKSRLQELAQSRLHSMPHYTLLARRGPDHDSRFQVEARVGDHAAQGEGSSKQAAEQHAAGVLLAMLEGADAGVIAADDEEDR
jgi:ribonuclease-3